jgi:hypothetical protein
VEAAKKHKRHADSDSDDDDYDSSKGFRAKDLPPLSKHNEKKVLSKIYALAKEAYD